MALVQVIKETFIPEEGGKPINYERLAIMGYIDGTEYTLKLKLSPAELLTAKMLLNSGRDSGGDISYRKADDSEKPTIKRKEDSYTSILDDDGEVGALFN